MLVFIHGGGYTTGSNSSPWFHGGSYNRDGVVVVNINYRLGIEGFLAIDGAASNRGVRDCVAALEWVRDNVANFGGDPARVTIAGQSAGGGMVGVLLAVPAARGLFRRAIPISGVANMTPPGNPAAVARNGLRTAWRSRDSGGARRSPRPPAYRCAGLARRRRRGTAPPPLSRR